MAFSTRAVRKHFPFYFIVFITIYVLFFLLLPDKNTNDVIRMLIQKLPSKVPSEQDVLESIKNRLSKRHAHVVETCIRHPEFASIKALQRWTSLIPDRLEFCSLPKCGTTFMERTLSPTLTKINPKNTNDSFPHGNKKRMLFVREPYSRIVSAFFSKIVGHPDWWRVSGDEITRLHRPNATDLSIRCGHDVTFPEYIKFVIRMHQPDMEYREPHFLRIMDVCNVCTQTPDFIGKLENIEEEMTYILRTVGMAGNVSQGFVEVQHLARLFMSFRHTFKNCGPMCPIIERYWYGQQATGLISFDIDFPLKREEECRKVTGDKLAEMAWLAHQDSVDIGDKEELKKRVAAELFQQVTPEDKETLHQLLRPECELFEYDDRPVFVFPRPFTGK